MILIIDLESVHDRLLQKQQNRSWDRNLRRQDTQKYILISYVK